MTFKMPQQLQNPTFRFVPLRSSEGIDKQGIIGKRPLEKGWGKGTKVYTQQELPAIIEKLPGAAKERCGVMGGFGNLAGLDADNPTIQEAIEKNFSKTFKIRSISKNKDGSAKIHYYAILTEPLPDGKTIPLINPTPIMKPDGKKDYENWGHIRWFGGQLVAPNSKLRGGIYEIVQDIPIAIFETEKLLSVLAPFIKTVSQNNAHKNTPLITKDTVSSDINLLCSDIVPLTSLTDRKLDGKYQGGHPFHTSSTQWDFELDTIKNTWFCFSHNTGGDAFQLIAMKEGLLQCHECGKGALRGEKFKQVLQIAKTQYGLQEQTKPEPKEAPLPIIMKELPWRDYAYFRKLKKDKRFVVKGMILPRTVNVLYSPPKNLKSIIAAGIAISVSQGRDFLQMKTKKNHVAILDRENNEQEMKRRLDGLHAGMGITQNRNMHFLVQYGDLLDHVFIQQLRNDLLAKKIKLLIIDTLHRFADYEENSADDINRIYTRTLQPLALECDCAIIFLHHTTKDGDYRGSSDFLGCVDTAYAITQQNGKFKLSCRGIRWGTFDDVRGEVSFNQDETIVISRTSEKEIAKETIVQVKAVTDLIKSLFSKPECILSRREIIENLRLKEEWKTIACSDKTIDRRINWLVLNDQLKDLKKGKFQRMWGVFDANETKQAQL